MLSIHLYHHSQQKANVSKKTSTLFVQGTNSRHIDEDQQNHKSHNQTTAEEETLMIPVEDIINISSQLDVKKAVQADIQSTIIPTYDFLPNCFDGCWDSTTDCCSKSNKLAPVTNSSTIITHDSTRNTEYEEIELPIPRQQESCCDALRCCCCRKKILVKNVQRKKVHKETEAQRVITMNIEYSKYSNPNTPSHTRLLDTQAQLEYYKKKFDAEKTLKFYLVNNTEFDPANFEVKKKEAETLSRTVMQLKGMRDHYPSERDLDVILGLNYKQAFGDLYKEPSV